MKLIKYRHGTTSPYIPCTHYLIPVTSTQATSFYPNVQFYSRNSFGLSLKFCQRPSCGQIFVLHLLTKWTSKTTVPQTYIWKTSWINEERLRTRNKGRTLCYKILHASINRNIKQNQKPTSIIWNQAHPATDSLYIHPSHQFVGALTIIENWIVGSPLSNLSN